jgi:hypothetical protein
VADRFFAAEAGALEERMLLRVALALAWFEVETGDIAATLKDLVPRYLSSVPLSPVSGEPLGYSEGTLRLRGFEWRGRRRVP